MFAGLSRMSMFDTYHMLDKKAPVAPKAVVKTPVVAAPKTPKAPVSFVEAVKDKQERVKEEEEKPRPKLRVIHALLASEKPKRETVMGKLWAEARTKGIPNYNKLKKAELLAALQSK